jgi:hypothetical protein
MTDEIRQRISAIDGEYAALLAKLDQLLAAQRHDLGWTSLLREAEYRINARRAGLRTELRPPNRAP